MTYSMEESLKINILYYVIFSMLPRQIIINLMGSVLPLFLFMENVLKYNQGRSVFNVKKAPILGSSSMI